MSVPGEGELSKTLLRLRLIRSDGQQLLEVRGGYVEVYLPVGDWSLLEGVHALVGDAEQPGCVFSIIGIDGEAEGCGHAEGLPIDQDGSLYGALNGA